MKGKIHHTEIYVKDLSLTKEFWGWLLGELGYQVYQEWQEGISYILDDTYLVFVQVLDHHLDVSYHRCKAGLNHIAFDGGSRAFVDELTQKLIQRGVPLLYEDKHPYANGPDYYAVFFEDPDRMKVEITAL